MVRQHDLRQKYQVVCVMRDNAGENQVQGIGEFFNLHGICSHFCESYKQWHNGSAYSTICFIMMLAQTIMAISGAAGRFWFWAAATGKDARNATFKASLGTSRHAIFYGEP
jgi:hypothetical protein